jgi:genome maintenance exonuclease 1
MTETKWLIKTPAEFICTDNYYLIKGKKFARVTRINSIIDKPELRNWYAKTGAVKAKEILHKRAGFGSTLHKLIEVTLKNEVLSKSNYEPSLIESIELFEKWQGKHEVKPDALEQHLWSDKYQYAGTADYIGMFDGKLYILDWKTSRGIYDEYWLQMAAYVQAFEELTGLKIEGVGILQIRDGETNFIIKTRDEIMKVYFPVFLAAITIYNWKYRGNLE